MSDELTPEEVPPALRGDEESEGDRLALLEAKINGLTDLVERQEHMLKLANDEIDRLLADKDPRIAAILAEQDAEREPERRAAPQGVTRFVSPYRNYAICIEHGWRGLQEGRLVTVPDRIIRFENGIYDTTDPVEIEALRNCEDWGTAIFENPMAVPVTSTAIIHDGARGVVTGSRPGPARQLPSAPAPGRADMHVDL